MANYRNSTSGSIAANGESVAIEYRLFTNGAAGVQVTGTFTATLELQTTIDGTNYVAVQGLKVSDGTDAPTITAVGIYRYELVGSKGCRVKATAHTSGTAVVTLAAMEG